MSALPKPTRWIERLPIKVRDPDNWLDHLIEQFGFTEFCLKLQNTDPKIMHFVSALSLRVEDYAKSAQKRIERREIYKLIAHGDAGHRQWLADALREYFS